MNCLKNRAFQVAFSEFLKVKIKLRRETSGII